MRTRSLSLLASVGLRPQTAVGTRHCLSPVTGRLFPIFCLVVTAVAITPRHAIADSTSPGCSLTALTHNRHWERTLEVAGTQRRYVLDVPDSVKASVAVPLVFDFHGFGHSGEGVWRVSGFKRLAESAPFITVYPEGLPITLLGREPRPGWEIKKLDGNRDLAFVQAMLDDLEKSFCIDRDRVYATGFSNGAFLSHILGCTMSDTFAAIAPVSGGDFFVDCAPQRRVAVIIHHGRRDPLIAVAQAQAARDSWVKRNGCGAPVADGACQRYQGCPDGADVVYCEEELPHSWPEDATERIWKFFASHPRAHR